MIYMPIPLEGHELCHPVHPEGFEAINLAINGEPRGELWRSPTMRIMRADQGRALLPSESPWLGAHALIFRPRALDALAALLRADGELLSLDCADDELRVFNPRCVIDAFDEEASSCTRFTSGAIMMIGRYVFRAEALRGVESFKIPNLRVSPTFVSKKFVAAWNSAGLAGLTFKQVWAPS
jgi:hypothetical protein